uniref:CBS domain-containing protein n=1 Tax=Staphylococcus epidermidis TaxID=1282 RepID=UPI0037DA1C0E
ELPIISSSYDTFLLPNIINKTIFNQKIPKEILLLQHILKPINQLSLLFHSITIHHYKKIPNQTPHTTFPILNQQFKLLPILTTTQIINMNQEHLLAKVMTKNP